VRAWRRTRAMRPFKEIKLTLDDDFAVVRRRERWESGRRTINMLIVRHCRKHHTAESRQFEIAGQLFDDGTCRIETLKLPGSQSLTFLLTDEEKDWAKRLVHNFRP